MNDLLSGETRYRVCLNGVWQFAPSEDALDVLPTEYGEKGISVPSPYNVNSFNASYTRRYGAGDETYVEGADFRLYPSYPAAWDRAKCGFYRRTFRVPDTDAGERLFLCFDAVAFHSVIYVNGVRLLESMEAFLPLEVEITDAVNRDGENEVVVACESARYLTYKGKDGRNRLDYPRGSFWGEHIAGIWQDVWLEARPASFVADVFAVPDTEARTLTVTCRTDGAKPGDTLALQLRPSGTDAPWQTLLTADTPDGTVVWQWQEGEVALWDSFDPHLYDLRTQLCREGSAVDARTVRIGFRTMKAVGEKFYLNGKPIQLKCDAWHYLGYSVQTPAFARAYFEMAKGAGVNIIRLHAEPFPSFYTDIADEMGMLIVSESAVWASHCMFSYSPAFFAHSREHLARLILRDRNHPSVVMWSPENECIPAYMFCGSDYVPSIPALEEEVFNFLQVVYEYDTSRLISCDGSGDLGGRLPVNSLHYPHYDCPTHRGKPITIGENGSMYYSTPDTVTREYGRAAIESFRGRLSAVAEEAYGDMLGQRKWASQICVFNLLWYGLSPLPFPDKPLEQPDPSLPGIKPERLTPYLRTLNAGGDEALPAFVPNPVYERTAQIYRPLAAFGEHIATVLFAGEPYSCPVTVFNDLRDSAEVTLSVCLVCNGETASARMPLTLAACTYREETLTMTLPAAGHPDREGILGTGLLAIALTHGGETLLGEEYSVTVLDRAAVDAAYRATGVVTVAIGAEETEDAPGGVIDCRMGAPYGNLTHEARQKHIFDGETGAAIAYPDPVPCRIFDEALCMNALPALTDGRGVALALSLTPAGERRILCGLPLAEATDAASSLLRLRLAERLAAAEVTAPEKPYYLGDPASPLTAMLSELGCETEAIDETALRALLNRRQTRLLIVDESAGFDRYDLFSGENFARVLLLAPEKLPLLLRNKLGRTPERLYHLMPGKASEVLPFGLSSNLLYGLEPGQEQPLCTAALVCTTPAAENLLAVPDVDFMTWNNTAEPLKTVAVLRSELRDRSALSGMVRLTNAGTEFYVTTLSANADSPKLRTIWSRILSGLHTALETRSGDEMENLFFGGMYAGRIRRMLCRELTAGENPALASPALNRIENGRAWVIADAARAQKPRTGSLYGVYIRSPQDRRDLLLNPDFIRLKAEADADMTLWLNGETVGNGRAVCVDGLPLASGVNLLTVAIEGECAMPRLTLERDKSPQLDLSFGLLPELPKAVEPEGRVWVANTNNTYSSHAAFTREHFWSTVKRQEPGIWLDFATPKPTRWQSAWFWAIKFHEEGADLTPRRFRILSGEDAEHLTEIYASLPEAQMCYPCGRVFFSLPAPVEAKYFRFELLEAAPKEFVMADLKLLL